MSPASWTSTRASGRPTETRLILLGEPVGIGSARRGIQSPAMAPGRLPDLSLTEWAVLAVAVEQPTYGFAIAKELASEGDLGRIWTVPRPLVYRALMSLQRGKLVEALGEETGDRGPNRTRIRATSAGKAAVNRWLATPTSHVRDLRTRLLLQLRLLDRRHADLVPLAAAQLDRLEPIIDSLENQMSSTSGFDNLLVTWRYESAQAAARTLRALLAQQTPATSTRARRVSRSRVATDS
jgi:DNA-binding PadR family transcriptional regulator